MAQTADANPVNSGDTAWMLISSALVLLMTPGLAFFYGGTRASAQRPQHHDDEPDPVDWV